VIGRGFYIPPKFRKAKSAERAGVNPAHPALRSTSASGRPCPRDLEWEPSTARMRRDGAGSVSARELGNTAPRLKLTDGMGDRPMLRSSVQRDPTSR
jgi:hypothetical protein